MGCEKSIFRQRQKQNQRQIQERSNQPKSRVQQQQQIKFQPRQQQNNTHHIQQANVQRMFQKKQPQLRSTAPDLHIKHQHKEQSKEQQNQQYKCRMIDNYGNLCRHQSCKQQNNFSPRSPKVIQQLQTSFVKRSNLSPLKISYDD